MRTTGSVEAAHHGNLFYLFTHAHGLAGLLRLAERVIKYVADVHPLIPINCLHGTTSRQTPININLSERVIRVEFFDGREFTTPSVASE